MSWRFIIFLSFNLVLLTQGKTILFFHKVTYNISNPELLDINIKLKNVSKPYYKLDLQANVFQDISSLYVVTKLLLPLGGKYRNNVYNKTVDLCAYLAKEKTNRVLNTIFTGISKYGVIPQACPIEKGHYYLKNFNLFSTKVPSYIPRSKFQIIVQFYQPQAQNTGHGNDFKITWYGDMADI